MEKSKILDGKLLSQTIKSEIAEDVQKLIADGKRAPHLAAVIIGDDPASQSYVRSKVKACELVGFGSTLIRKPASISQKELLDIVNELNNDIGIDGFIVQLPLPSHIDEMVVTLAINPNKDVDGFHPENIGKMALGLDCFLPATPFGILKILERNNIETEGKNCVVIGRSNIVGTPMSILMSRKSNPGNATVTLVHSRTKDLKAELKRADIIIAAIGIPNFVKAEMIKDGVVIIDVGINRVEDKNAKRGYRLVGDVDFDDCLGKCSAITPVPGGVGPMTVTSLLINTLKAAK